MDVFRDIGNFFKGAFGGDSEEEKRRKKQQQQAAAKKPVLKPVQKPSSPQQVNDLFGIKKKPTDPIKPINQAVKKPPVVVAPPTLAPPVVVNPEVAKEKARQQSEIAAFGKIRNPSTKVMLSKDEYNAAVERNKALSKPTLNPVAVANEEIAKAPLTVAKSLADFFVIKPATDIYEGVRDQVRAQEVKKDIGKYGDPKYVESELKEINRAEKSGEVNKKRANELRQQTQSNAQEAKKQGSKAKAEYKAKYGEDIKTQDENFAKAGGGAADLTTFGLGTAGVNLATKAGVRVLKGKTVEQVVENVVDVADEGSKSLVGLWQSVFGKKPNSSEKKLLEEGAKGAPKSTPQVGKTVDKTPDTPKPDDLVTTERKRVLDEAQTPGTTDNIPAYQRKRAKAEADAAEAARNKAEFDADPLNKPAIQHKRELEDVVRREEDTFNQYVAEHPNLTQQQLEAAREVATKRAIKLTDELKASRAAGLNSLDEQAKVLDESAQTRVNAADKVEAEQAAANTPAKGDKTQSPEGASPEVKANDATRPSTEDVLYGDTPSITFRDDLSVGQRFSPDRIIREHITRPIENLADRGVNALQTADNRVAQGLGRFFTGWSRELGVTPGLQTAKMQLRGGVQSGKVHREAIADLGKNMKDDSKTQIWATLDPEFAGRKGVVSRELTPDETVVRDKLKTIIDNTTSENLRRGLVTPEAAANESYIKRSYSIYDGNAEVGKFEQGFRQELMGQFKGRKQVSNEMVELAITDPTYLVGKKTAESNAIWAMQDYGNWLTNTGKVIDRAQQGFRQLPDSPVFGDAAGKFVPTNIAEDFTGFQYNNAMTTAFNDLITAYDRFGIRQAKKQLLTIFNPAVRLGNQVANRGIFSQLNGINPVQFNIVMPQAKKEIAQGGQYFREATEQGLTGVDITQADFFAQRIAASAGQDKNIARKALEWAQTSYSGADDQARVAAYMIHRNRGYSKVEAARLTQRGFQDYKSVGFFYDMAAKTPLIGNAFVRFAADAVRIAKNAAVDHPLRSMATVGAWSTFVNAMSVASGESELKGDNIATQAFNLATGNSKSDAQKERENRFGAPKIPFTDISTTVQTPWGEVNVARFMPWYQLNEIGGSVSRFLPFQQSPINIEDGKLAINGAGFNDPLLGQLVQLGVDRDFRNQSIQDPELNPDKPDMFRKDPLSDDEKLRNVARFLLTGNAPLGKEFDQTYSAATGQPDIYGKDRNIWQAILRDFGLKVEQQGAEQQKKRSSMNDYHTELAEIDKDMEDLKMSPEAREAYKRLTGYYKMREDVPNEFSPGDTRKKKAEVYNFGEDKWKDYAAHPELYQVMVNKKMREAAKDGKPLQPEFDERLPLDFRKQLIQNKMVAPGDDAELDQRMYSSPEWDYYQGLKDEYKAKAKAYYPQNGDEIIDDETVKHQDAKFPTKPDLLKAYGAAYGEYTDGKRDKPQFTDELKVLKEQYNKETFNWTNNERAARGLPAIVWDMWNNPTFGYDETPPSGYGYGYGSGGGGGGGGKSETNTLGELTNFSDSVKGYAPVEAQAMPDLVRMFQTLQAGKGGGKVKPKLGASSSGT